MYTLNITNIIYFFSPQTLTTSFNDITNFSQALNKIKQTKNVDG